MHPTALSLSSPLGAQLVRGGLPDKQTVSGPHLVEKQRVAMISLDNNPPGWVNAGTPIKNPTLRKQRRAINATCVRDCNDNE